MFYNLKYQASTHVDSGVGCDWENWFSKSNLYDSSKKYVGFYNDEDQAYDIFELIESL